MGLISRVSSRTYRMLLKIFNLYLREPTDKDQINKLEDISKDDNNQDIKFLPTLPRKLKRDTKTHTNYHKMLKNPVRYRQTLKAINEKMGPIWSQIMIKGNPNIMKCRNCKNPPKCAQRMHMVKLINKTYDSLNPNNINTAHDAPFKNAEKHHLAILEENQRQLDEQYRKLGFNERSRKRYEIWHKIRDYKSANPKNRHNQAIKDIELKKIMIKKYYLQKYNLPVPEYIDVMTTAEELSLYNDRKMKDIRVLIDRTDDYTSNLEELD